MKKNTVRVMFNGDTAENSAHWLYDNVRLSGFYSAFELDQEHEDAVLIEFSPHDHLTQAQYLFILLSDLNSWHFVGPKCPDVGSVSHPKGRRFMHATNMHDNGDAFTCFGCRKRLPMSFAPTFMDQKDLKLFMMLDMLKGMRPMPHPKERRYPEKAPQTLTGRVAYNPAFDMKVAIDTETTGLNPTKKERNNLTQQLLGVDYSTVELATLFHSLGMRHTIDVKTLTGMTYGTEGADWIDQGGGAVLLIEGNDNVGKARNVVSSWMRTNQTSERYVLALVEVDKQNLNGDIFNKEIVQKAAQEFTKVRKNIATDKRIESFAKPLPMEKKAAEKFHQPEDYKMTPDMMRRVQDIEMDGARGLIDMWFKRWPEIKQHYNSEITARLIIENRDLAKQLKESDEALSNSNTKLDELVAQQKREEGEPSLVKAADAFLRFMAGINMQDHSVQEQREFNSKFSALKDELMKLGIGSTPGKQHVGKGQC